MPEISDTSVPAGLIPASPAPGADDQKPNVVADSPAPVADAENPETPEQQEERKQSRRARARERQIAELAEARTEARLLREQLERQGRQQAPAKADAEPKREQYENLEDYYDARASYRAKVEAERIVNERFQAQQGREQQQRQAQGNADLAKTWDQKEKDFQKGASDYTEVVTPFLDGGLKDLSSEARKAIVELGPVVLYNLANLEETNPQEFSRISGLSPARQIAELGKLESQAVNVKTSSAPPPARPIGSGRAGQTDLSKMSDAEYKAARKAQGARWAQ